MIFNIPSCHILEQYVLSPVIILRHLLVINSFILLPVEKGNMTHRDYLAVFSYWLISLLSSHILPSEASQASCLIGSTTESFILYYDNSLASTATLTLYAFHPILDFVSDLFYIQQNILSGEWRQGIYLFLARHTLLTFFFSIAILSCWHRVLRGKFIARQELR